MKQRKIPRLAILLAVLCLTLLVTACGSEQTTPTPTSTATLVPTLAVNETDETSGESAETSIQNITVDELAKILANRTPVPSPTPGPVDRAVEQLATGSGLGGKSLLGLRASDWINLAVSALVVLISSLVVIPLLSVLLNWIVHRTKTQFDDQFLATIGRELRWLVVIILTRGAVLRLDFLDDELRILLDDLFFLLTWVVFYIIALRLITFIVDRYLNRLKSEEDRQRLVPIMTTLQRLGYIFVSLVALSFAAIHFGIEVALPSVVLITIVVVVAIAARAAIDDAVNGFIILIDRPFRIGDDILIKELDTSGEVAEIGIRSTRVHLGDNRTVIIPNSLIGESQVVNYTYPNPMFRIQTEIGVAYGTDITLMRQVVTKTVRGVEGVLAEKPVDVFFLAFGDSARQVRVRWWIDSFNYQNISLDRVNEALELALAEAGIDLPNPTYDLNLQNDISKRNQSTIVSHD